jgi:digeranylgeranylglycerophospholipid reductase
VFEKQYDIVVIGAGPAGNNTARFCADKGYSVLQLEKRPVIGVPVRCGEATSTRKRLLDFGPITEDFIETDLNGIVFYGTGDIKITVRQEDLGLMLDRVKFDQFYADLAVKAGVHQYTSARVTNISAVQNNKRTVYFNYDNADHEVQATIVVGADGVEALSGRWVGLKTRQLPPYTCSAIEMKIDQMDPNPDCITFWHGHDYINSGYIWSFPKVKSGVTNFGAGFIFPGPNKPNIQELTEEYRQKFFPGSKLLDVYGGCVPVSGQLEQDWADNFILVGDSGHHTNPMTGGGITAAMSAAQFAGEAIHEAFVAGDFSETRMKDFRRRCDDWFGKMHDKQLKIRNYVLKMNREEQIQFYQLVKVFAEKGKVPALLRYPIRSLKVARDFWRM